MSCFLFLWVLFIWMAWFLGPRPSWVLSLSALLRQSQSQDHGLEPWPACSLPWALLVDLWPSSSCPFPPYWRGKLWLFLPAAWRPPQWSVISWIEATPPHILPQGRILLLSSHPFATTARATTLIPDHRELSDMEALSPLGLAPKCSHQHVLQVQGLSCW